MRRMLGLQLVDVLKPVDMYVGLHLGQQLAQDRFQVAHHAHGGLDVLVHLRGVDVHVDELSVGRESGYPAGHPVVETHAQADD